MHLQLLSVFLSRADDINLLLLHITSLQEFWNAISCPCKTFLDATSGLFSYTYEIMHLFHCSWNEPALIYLCEAQIDSVSPSNQLQLAGSKSN